MTTEEIKAAREMAASWLKGATPGSEINEERMALMLNQSLDEVEHQRADIDAMLLTHQVLADAVEKAHVEDGALGLRRSWAKIRQAILVMAGRRDA